MDIQDAIEMNMAQIAQSSGEENDREAEQQGRSAGNDDKGRKQERGDAWAGG